MLCALTMTQAEEAGVEPTRRYVRSTDFHSAPVASRVALPFEQCESPAAGPVAGVTARSHLLKSSAEGKGFEPLSPQQGESR